MIRFGISHFALGELALVFLLGLALPPAPAQETQLSNNWSIVALSEEFGVFDSLRIEAGSRVELCRFEDGKFLQRASLAHAEGELAGLLSDLGAEIERLATRRWEKDPDPTADLPPITSPRDGPAWTINLIEQDANSAKVRRLAGFARVNSLVNSILNDIGGQAERPPSASGVLVLGPRRTSETNPDEPKRTDDALARRLLAETGTFLPDPVPREFQQLLQGQNAISSVEADGLPFTLRRLRP